MASLNVPRPSIHTHEGGKAKHINPELQLRRAVMSCMLWEKSFYEDGEKIADRICRLIPKVNPTDVVDIAIKARGAMKLRHVPLLIAREMARLPSHREHVGALLARIIQRPDELTEFLAIYWRDGRQPLSAQVKKGLAGAFTKFNEYQLAKYNRDKAIKLRDVLFLCHAKPIDKEQEALWKRLINDKLATPDTWEVALSSGGNKRLHWTRLLTDNRLGALALLRNLRNFKEANVDDDLVKNALINVKTSRVLPFRFITAARYAPQWEPQIEAAMLRCLSDREHNAMLPGKTVMLLDVSGSMRVPVSGRSQISRMDAAFGVAMLLRELCEDIDIFTFSMELVRIPARRGFALSDACKNSQEHSGTPLGVAVKAVYAPTHWSQLEAKFGYRSHPIVYHGQNLMPDRLIVVTDEQAADKVPDPRCGDGYMVNVASEKNGVGYGAWTHIDGWSEAVIDYIKTFEKDLM